MNLMPYASLAMTLPPPLDLIEEGERISAFWQVYVVDKAWSRVMGVPSMVVDDPDEVVLDMRQENESECCRRSPDCAV